MLGECHPDSVCIVGQVMLASSQVHCLFFDMRNVCCGFLYHLLVIDCHIELIFCLHFLPILFSVNCTENEHRSVDDASSKLDKLAKDTDSKESIGELDFSEIEILLPGDEQELLAGIADDFDSSRLPYQGEDVEDCDIFGSGGGMELDCDPSESLVVGVAKMSISDGYSGNGSVQYNGVGSVAGEHPYGEHPSRTLFVRNINSSVEDSELRSLFEVTYNFMELFLFRCFI